MATIKNCTDLPQSKKLAEILPLESADMYYYSYMSIGEPFHMSYPNVIEDRQRLAKNDIPCWSLAALLDVLPFPQLSKDKLGSGKEGWMVSVYPDNCRYDSCWHDNPVDACYEMIIKLHEQKLL